MKDYCIDNSAKFGDLIQYVFIVAYILYKPPQT